MWRRRRGCQTPALCACKNTPAPGVARLSPIQRSCSGASHPGQTVAMCLTGPWSATGRPLRRQSPCRCRRRGYSGRRGATRTPREYLIGEYLPRRRSSHVSPRSRLRHTPVRLEMKATSESGAPTATACRSNKSTSGARSRLTISQVLPASGLLATPPTSIAAYTLSGLPASMARPRIRVGNLIPS